MSGINLLLLLQSVNGPCFYPNFLNKLSQIVFQSIPRSKTNFSLDLLIALNMNTKHMKGSYNMTLTTDSTIIIFKWMF